MKIYLIFLAFFILAASASADTLGDNRVFFISPQYDIGGETTVTATLRYTSNRAYFYVADDFWRGLDLLSRSRMLNQISSLGSEFDGHIYPVETGFFGSEPNPGVDGDGRVTILLALLVKTAGGYYDTANQFLRTEIPNSNEREIIYLNAGDLDDEEKMFSFLAHEFQHLISFNQKENLRRVSDDIWVNELRSEYATTLAGYNDSYEGSHLQRRAHAFAKDPTDSLTEWKNLPADYGQIGMLGEYIAEHYSPQVVADSVNNDLVGVSSINEALARNNFSDTFLDVYRNWLIAGILNDKTANPAFGYGRSELKDLVVEPTRIFAGLSEDAIYTISDLIKDWQGKWYDITQLTAGGKNNLKIVFDSPSLASFDVSYLVFGVDGSYRNFTFKPLPGSNILYVPQIGTDVSRVVIMPIKKDKLSGFSANETPVSLAISIERTSSLPENAILPQRISKFGAESTASATNQLLTANYSLQTTHYSDGSLIRARGDIKVYVIKGNWRRHIISPEIFKLYPGILGFDKVQEVEPSVLTQYAESSLVRYVGEQKVYNISANGTRHWLNMTGEQFSRSGRSWESVFIINSGELDFYKESANITE